MLPAHDPAATQRAAGQLTRRLGLALEVTVTIPGPRITARNPGILCAAIFTPGTTVMRRVVGTGRPTHTVSVALRDHRLLPLAHTLGSF